MKTAAKSILILLTLVIAFVSPGLANTYNVNYQAAQTVTLNNSINPANLASLQVTVSPVYTHVNPDALNGLISYWTLNDLQANTATNSVQNGQALSFSNSPSVVSGKYDQAVSISNNRAFITDPLLNCSACAISCWFYKTANVTNAAIYADYVSGGYNDLLYENSAGGLSWSISNGNAGSATGISSNPISVNQWHFVTAVFNGSTGEQSIYIDGVKTTRQATATAIGPTQYECSVGYWDVQSAYFAGSLDDLALYNRSLSQTEVNNLYYNDIQGLTVKTNSNSNTATVLGLTNIPFSVTDSSITGLTFAVPSSQVINGRTVNDYSTTVSPFTVTLTTSNIPAPVPVTSKTQSGQTTAQIFQTIAIIVPVFGALFILRGLQNGTIPINEAAMLAVAGTVITIALVFGSFICSSFP